MMTERSKEIRDISPVEDKGLERDLRTCGSKKIEGFIGNEAQSLRGRTSPLTSHWAAPPPQSPPERELPRPSLRE
jgi:hypothetical protein